MDHNSSDVPDKPNQPVGKERRLGAIKIQLNSQLPSDVRRGTEQAGKLLREDPSNQEIYHLLLGVAREFPSQREEIKKLFQSLILKDESQAKEALKQLESIANPNPSESNSGEKHTATETKPPARTIIDDADDAYYAGEFDKAINLYSKVLQHEPDNKRAQMQLEKAELNRIGQQPNRKLSRDAMQNYRRARSFIAARDINSAIGMLNAAIEEAQEQGLRFQEAEELLGSQLGLQIAAQYKDQAIKLVQDGNWDDAIEKYDQILKLDPTDDASQSMREKLNNLTGSEAILVTLSDSLDTDSDRKAKLDNIASSIKAGEGILKLASTQRFKSIRARYGLYRAESDLHSWGALTVLAPQGRLIEIQRAAKDVLEPRDPAVRYVEDQLRRFRSVRLFLLLLLAAIIIIAFQFLSGKFTVTPPIVSLTLTPTMTPAFTKTIRATTTIATISTGTTPITSTPTLTETAIPASQQLLDTGYIGVLLIHPQDKPNGKWVGELRKYQPVSVLQQKISSGDAWYFCEWTINGVTQQGWILAQYITIGPTPTPRP